MLLIGATSVFAELQSDLDRIWRAPALPHISGVISLLRSRMLSFGMVVAMGFLLLVSLVIGAALSALGQWGGTMIAGSADMLQVLNTVVTFGITTLLFATAYRILPRVRIAWSDVWMGAVVTAILFTLGKYPDRPLHRSRRRELQLRRRRIAHHRARVGLLFGADLPAWRGIYLGVRPPPRVARRGAARRAASSCAGHCQEPCLIHWLPFRISSSNPAADWSPGLSATRREARSSARTRSPRSRT